MSKLIIRLLLILITSLGLSMPGNTSTLYQSNYHNYQFYPAINIISIPNFHRVDNNVFRGAQPDENDYSKLAELGIKTIIDLQPKSDKKISERKSWAKKLGINYINIPMHPSVPPTDKQILSVFRVLDNAKNLPVFIHCRQGKDRTGIMIALYRVRKYRWDFDKAYDEMKNHGYHSALFPKQKKFLADYVKSYQLNVQSKLLGENSF